jgi:hypothetical protein
VHVAHEAAHVRSLRLHELREAETVTLEDPIWKNPYQRFGFINVKVLIGDVTWSDIDIFFGPMHDNDIVLRSSGTVGTTRFFAQEWGRLIDPPFAEFEAPPTLNMSKLLSRLGVFESTKEADRHGFKVPIPEGFSDWMKIRKKHRVTILKITEPSQQK